MVTSGYFKSRLSTFTSSEGYQACNQFDDGLIVSVTVEGFPTTTKYSVAIQVGRDIILSAMDDRWTARDSSALNNSIIKETLKMIQYLIYLVILGRKSAQARATSVEDVQQKNSSQRKLFSFFD